MWFKLAHKPTGLKIGNAESGAVPQCCVEVHECSESKAPINLEAYKEERQQKVHRQNDSQIKSQFGVRKLSPQFKSVYKPRLPIQQSKSNPELQVLRTITDKSPYGDDRRSSSNDESPYTLAAHELREIEAKLLARRKSDSSRRPTSSFRSTIQKCKSSLRLDTLPLTGVRFDIRHRRQQHSDIPKEWLDVSNTKPGQPQMVGSFTYLHADPYRSRVRQILDAHRHLEKQRRKPGYEQLLDVERLRRLRASLH
ncbi:uncharacterized protein V1516DRAFT_662186 [Lipomyces oligophaga]|uniref:uncharacterized protein n=1 Tax=Lipomyces oligophaga TaxID=45792 RepID=UPI0034CE5C44